MKVDEIFKNSSVELSLVYSAPLGKTNVFGTIKHRERFSKDKKIFKKLLYTYSVNVFCDHRWYKMWM